MSPLVDLHAVVEGHLFLRKLVLEHPRADLEHEEPVKHAHQEDEDRSVCVVGQALKLAVVRSDQRTEEHEEREEDHEGDVKSRGLDAWHYVGRAASQDKDAKTRHAEEDLCWVALKVDGVVEDV